MEFKGRRSKMLEAVVFVCGKETQDTRLQDSRERQGSCVVL